MAVQKSFSDDLCDHYKSHDWNQIAADGFDTALAHRAEIFSAKWVQLYERSPSTHGTNYFTQTIEKTAIGVHHLNRFNVQKSTAAPHLNSHPDAITERKNLILLDKKYFEFEASLNSSESVDPSPKDNIDMYSTVFHDTDDQSEHDLDSNVPICGPMNYETAKPKKTDHKTQRATTTKKDKKKKGRTQYRPLIADDATTTSSECNMRASNDIAAAPPGAKVISPLTNSRRMDLIKCGNHSLQFQL